MSSDTDFKLAWEVFAEVCDAPEAERRDVVAARCADRPEARRLVERMLAEDDADTFALALSSADIDRDALGAAAAAGATLKLPAHIGRYRVIRECGRGGMGAVYEAEQDTPRRRVALKMIRAGSTSRDLLRRFRYEAEILGRLQHPGIGQIFEAGSVDLGEGAQPYFAMEFIEGETLIAYARTHELSSRDRLDLMARVCDAVHYAHQRGVIHRDLKPDNIIVSAPGTDAGARGSDPDPGTSVGQPKILDFGIARATDADMRVTTMRTSVGQLIGTVQYMSPEQASGNAANLDTRSDIYALGVILYELLTGRLPYDLRDLSVPQSLRTIQEDTPSRLSAHDAAFRGDIETIVGKCLEKETDRRYQSASELAEDIRRHIRDEPIAARPPSVLYQWRKFARRNRALVGGVAATIVVLAAGVVVATLFAVKSARNEARALTQAYRAGLVAAQGLIETDPLAAMGHLDVAPPEHRNWEWRHLKHRLTSDLEPLEVGGAIVGRPARADDGSVLAIRTDGAVLRWEGERPDERTVLTTLGPDVRSVAFSAGARRVAVMTASGLVRAHDLATDVTVDAPTLPGEGAVVIAWDGDGLVAVGPTLVGVWSPGSGADGWNARTLEPPLSPFCEFAQLLVRRGADRAVALAVPTVPDSFPRISVVEISTGRVVAVHTHGEIATCMALSPDGRQVATGYQFRSVRLLDAETLQETARPGAHRGQVTGVAYAPDGRWLCSTGADGTVRLWDPDGERPPTVLQATGPLHPLFSGDASRIMCVNGRQEGALARDRIRRWNVSNPGCTILRGGEGYVYDVSWSPDGTRVASWTIPADVSHIWDIRTGRVLQKLGDGEGKPVFRRDGMMVTSNGKRLSVVDPATGDAVSRRAAPPESAVFFGGYSGVVTVGSGVAEPPGPAIWRAEYSATRDDGFALRLFVNGDPVRDAVEGEWPDHAPAPVPHPLFVGFAPGTGTYGFTGLLADLVIFNGRLSAADTAAVEQHLNDRRNTGSGDFPEVASAALVARFVVDPSTLVIDSEGDVQSWTAANDRRIVVRREKDAPGRLRLDDTAMNGLPMLDFSEAMGGLEGTLPADIVLGDTTAFLIQRATQPNYATFSIGLGGSFGPALVRELRSILGSLAGVRFSNHLVFSPDGAIAAHVVEQQGVDLASAETDLAAAARFPGRGAWLWRLHGNYYCVAFHPNGRQLAVGGGSGTIEVWDIAEREKVAELTGHDGIVYSVAYSPDGSRLVSGGNDTTVRLWDSARSEQVMELRGHEQYVKAVLFSPDGARIASGSGDGTIRVWEAPAASGEGEGAGP